MIFKKMMPLMALLILMVLGSCAPGSNIPEGTGMVSLDVIGTPPSSGSLASVRSLSSTSRTAGTPFVLPVLDTAGTEIGSLTLTEVLMALKEIELEMEDSQVDTPEEAAQELEIEFEGPFLLNLVDETSTPSLENVYLLPGIYDEIELAIAKLEGDETDSDGTTPLVTVDHPLYGNSIYLSGSYTGATSSGSVTDMPFTFTLDLDEEFELTGIDDTSLGFEVVEGQYIPLLIAFRMAKWFDFSNSETNEAGLLDFSDVVESSGSILLDENQVGDNDSIRDIIKENIKESADYGEDEDGDGDLGSDEDDDPDEEDDDDY